jgi:repressor of nif and glnA expression
MSRETWLREEARLIILRTLAEEANETLNSNILLRELRERWMITRDRPWLHAELDFLAELGAVTLVKAESVKIATLTDRGRRHLDREIALDGVKRPSRPEA